MVYVFEGHRGVAERLSINVMAMSLISTRGKELFSFPCSGNKTKQRAVLSSATQHALSRKLAGNSKTGCLNNRFPSLTPPYVGFSVNVKKKLKLIIKYGHL